MEIFLVIMSTITTFSVIQLILNAAIRKNAPKISKPDCYTCVHEDVCSYRYDIIDVKLSAPNPDFKACINGTTTPKFVFKAECNMYIQNQIFKSYGK